MKLRFLSFLTTSARWFAVVALSATLVACGGGSGDDPDPDDGDGLPTIGGGDDLDPPIDGGDGSDPLVDGGGVDPSTDGCEGPAATSTDLDSSTPDWDDNCQVLVGGQHANSTYALGIQRIVFCRGNAQSQDIADLAAFADGRYGPLSEDAVKNFQTAQGLAPDGIVGPQSWTALQGVLDLLEAGTERNIYGVRPGICDMVTQFYQNRDPSGALARWTIAETPGSSTAISFGVDPAN